MMTMQFRDVAGDAKRAFEILRGGGIAIMPMDVGYSLIGGSGAALRRIFETKRRAASKLNAMVANHDIATSVYRLSPRGRDVIDCITLEYDLPLGAIAPFHDGHPMLASMDPETLEASTKDGTLVMLLNAGKFHAEVTRLSWEAKFPMFGSSANLSMTGTKFHGDDIEPEIRAIADIFINYGLMKYHPWRQSSTLINVETFEVVRVGSCYENIADIIKRHFGVSLPPKP
jgi:tRNA A37 threonylcarbamoyladenosine synthetase subunit TsaC/SUA5/YrdC